MELVIVLVVLFRDEEKMEVLLFVLLVFLLMKERLLLGMILNLVKGIMFCEWGVFVKFGLCLFVLNLDNMMVFVLFGVVLV